MSKKSRIVTIAGAQYPEIDGVAVPAAAYMTYFSEKAHYRDFAAAGYKFYSASVFFGSNKVNTSGNLDCFTPGVFDTEEGDFTLFDKDVSSILDACPEAMILPRINVNPSRKWELEHESELCYAGPPTNPELKRACLGSDLWADYVKECLRKFVDHVEASDYADSIIGYQIAGGQTEEWFAYDENGFSGERSREKYDAYIKTTSKADTKAEYYAFHAELCASRICELAGYVKELTGRRLIVGAFYGYTTELVARTTAHHALSTLLNSDNIDFICSPISYEGYRDRGFDHVYMVPVNSHKEHGKLYFLECDSRTHLSKPPFEHPRFDNPVWYGKNKATTLEALKMHFAKCLVHGHGFWWFDMWGGWYADEDYMNFFRRAREIAHASVGEPMSSIAEVAVFIDEKAYFELDDTSVSEITVRKSRLTLGSMGIPYDIYIASDFESVKDRYASYVILEPCKTAATEGIREYAIRAKKELVVIDKDRAALTSNELREMLYRGGVSIYSEKNAVVYASESYIFIHTAEDGCQILHTPYPMTLREVFTGEEFSADSKTVCFEAMKGESFLFRICDSSTNK